MNKKNKNHENIISGYSIYISMLYANWFAVEYLTQRGGRVFRVRLPYNTLARAKQMRNHLTTGVGTALTPDYQPHIHIVKNGIVR
ncbi:MAG: hypothetical protein K2M34_05065 [Alphaproteobacteria bacterium]|nr:hypothetical protein [Alphaproteobacteria bacterium]